MASSANNKSNFGLPDLTALSESERQQVIAVMQKAKVIKLLSFAYSQVKSLCKKKIVVTCRFPQFFPKNKKNFKKSKCRRNKCEICLVYLVIKLKHYRSALNFCFIEAMDWSFTVVSCRLFHVSTTWFEKIFS